MSWTKLVSDIGNPAHISVRAEHMVWQEHLQQDTLIVMGLISPSTNIFQTTIGPTDKNRLVGEIQLILEGQLKRPLP